jgi:hypothetical protein
MASELLGNETYNGLRADDFFSRLYRTRNDLVHRGVVDREELHVLVGEADRYVSNILQRHFVEPLPPLPRDGVANAPPPVKRAV